MTFTSQFHEVSTLRCYCSKSLFYNIPIAHNFLSNNIMTHLNSYTNERKGFNVLNFNYNVKDYTKRKYFYIHPTLQNVLIQNIDSYMGDTTNCDICTSTATFARRSFDRRKSDKATLYLASS